MKWKLMEKQRIKFIISQQLITKFLKTYYRDDKCNCKDCCCKRNQRKFSALKRSLLIPALFDNMPPNIWENGEIIIYLNRINNRLKHSIQANTQSGTFFSGVSEDRMTMCKYCGRIMMKNKFNPSNVCFDCLYSHYQKCKFCHKYICRKTMPKIQKSTGCCLTCISKTKLCADCNERCLITKMKKVSKIRTSNNRLKRNQYYCHNCATNIKRCLDCGEVQSPLATHLFQNNPYCYKCILKHQRLFEWNYQPKYNFNSYNNCTKIDKGGLFFGVELEIELPMNTPALGDREYEFDRDAWIKTIEKEFGEGKIYGKEDGSLYSGFEFVTHPFSFNWFNKNKFRFNQMYSMLHLKEMYMSERCGFHVHLSKSAFSTCHLYKFIDFINNKKHTPFINKVAKRDIRKSKYCKPYRHDSTDEKLRQHLYKQIAKHKNNCGMHKYSAVNLVPDKDTVEVRIFQGDLSVIVLYERIEFLHSLFEFTRKAPFKDVKLKNYKKFVKDNSNLYSNFYKTI